MYMYMWKRKAGKTEGRSRNRKSRNIDKIRINKDKTFRQTIKQIWVYNINAEKNG